MFQRVGLTAILTAVLCINGVVSAGTYSGGKGNAVAPYIIAKTADWQELMDTPGDWDKHFVLTDHLDLAWTPLTPVGNSSVNFTGVLDGAGYTLSNAVINQPTENHAGLFGYAAFPAAIFNLRVRNISVSGQNYVGGLAGRNNGGNLARIFLDGSVNAAGSYVGGIVGMHIRISGNGVLTESMASGSVTGSHQVGGLAGYNGTNAWVMLSYAQNSVDGNVNVGGLVGQNIGQIQMCYAAGPVNGTTDVGGLVGNKTDGVISASFWDIERSGQTVSAGGTGKTSAQMKLRNTYTDAEWDFINVWGIGQFQGYPYLRTRSAADITAEGIVNLEDFAVMAAQWLTTTPTIPDPPEQDLIKWVYIDDDGSGMKDGNGNPIDEGGFTGYMSKYLITNAQYAQYLNAALASGDVVLNAEENRVLGAIGSNPGQDFVAEFYYQLDGPGISNFGATNGGRSRINYSEGVFTVEAGFENHPVSYVSWYGATAFASYYGWRLPTEWEWQAVADYDGSYTYATGDSLYDSEKFLANDRANGSDGTAPNNLPYHPWVVHGTNEVGYFGTFGYGMADMAGNVWEWTSSPWFSGSSYRVLRGGGWYNRDDHCTVSTRDGGNPGGMGSAYGFRVCR